MLICLFVLTLYVKIKQSKKSPRFLLSQGRVAEADAILRKVSQMNSVEAPEVIFEEKTLVRPPRANGYICCYRTQ